MSKLLLATAIIPVVPAADQSDKRGYFVEASGTTAAVCNAATDNPIGVIVEGAPTTGRSSIAVGAGLPVKVKVGGTPGTIGFGTYLQLKNDGTVIADAATGARVIVARSIDTGATPVATELIDAVLITPIVYSS